MYFFFSKILEEQNIIMVSKDDIKYVKYPINIYRV